MKKAKKATEQVTVEMCGDEASRTEGSVTMWLVRCGEQHARVVHWHTSKLRKRFSGGAWFEVERPGFPALRVRSRDFSAALDRARVLLAVL